MLIFYGPNPILRVEDRNFTGLKKNKAGEGFSNLPFFGVFKAEHVEKEVVWEIFSRTFNFEGFIFSAEKTQSPGIS